MSRAPAQRRSRLDQTVTILSQSQAANGLNETTGEWLPAFTTRAKAYPSPGFERSVGDRNVAVAPITFEVRPEERTLAIKPSQKVRWNGIDYSVIAPIFQPSRGANVQIICAADQ